jgi:hypothetical protein
MFGFDPSISSTPSVVGIPDISGVCGAIDARVKPKHDVEGRQTKDAVPGTMNDPAG